jgi:hypothetical protein
MLRSRPIRGLRTNCGSPPRAAVSLFAADLNASPQEAAALGPAHCRTFFSRLPGVPERAPSRPLSRCLQYSKILGGRTSYPIASIFLAFQPLARGAGAIGDWRLAIGGMRGCVARWQSMNLKPRRLSSENNCHNGSDGGVQT